MAKLKSIIKQLGKEDYESLLKLLTISSADKSAHLLTLMYKQQLSDEKIMQELNVNTNAYYTLRSRLNQKIEEYLILQIESPRTDLLKKVANINEVVFLKNRTLAIATLKKIEKELIDYDLSNELIAVYKSLKKLHSFSDEYFMYSQLYNKQISYMITVDKVEFMLTDYFRKYGYYIFNNHDEDKLELSLLNNELTNICRGHANSHRLFIYHSFVNIFHRIFVESEDVLSEEINEPIEDIFLKMEKIFNQYKMDSSYFHLQVVLDFLKSEYYNHFRLYKKAEKYFEDLNEVANNLLTNFNSYTFTSRFMLTKLERQFKIGKLESLANENVSIFEDFEVDYLNIPQAIIYHLYRSICCYHADQYEEGCLWLNQILENVSLKKFQHVQLETRAILSVFYCLMKKYDQLNAIINTILRQIRYLGKEDCGHVLLWIKILQQTPLNSNAEKIQSVKMIINRLRRYPYPQFSFIRFLKPEDGLVEKIIK